jgi:hypothetical protein
MCAPLQPLRRVNFFTGQLLTAADFTAEQEYHRERLRLHNRCCHGWGVVCGLEVSARGDEVTIAPGMALDCQGEHVVLGTPSTLVSPGASPGTATLYVLISLREEPTDPTPVSGEIMAYRRVLEGSRLELDPEDPTVGHVRRRRRVEPCGQAHGVPLARLRWIGKRWRIDHRYTRRQAH